MVRKLIEWSLNNPLVVILLALGLLGIGAYSFHNVNVEAYPDPAPAIVEVVAQFPGASAEEVERQVTIPLEVTFAGMRGLKSIRSQSLFGLSDLKMNWNYGSEFTYEAARQEVINRLTTISQPLPPGVTPAISPESPTGEIYRYILKVPKDRPFRFKLSDKSFATLRAAEVPATVLKKLTALKDKEFEVRVDLAEELGKILEREELERFKKLILDAVDNTNPRELYTLNDLKAGQDWILEREFRSVQRIVDVTSFGGTVRRYEVQPDPKRMFAKGITLTQLQTALTNSNATVGGDYVNQGKVAFTVRSVGLFGGGADPVNKVLGIENKVLAEFLSNEVVMELVLGKSAANELKGRVAAGLAKLQVDPPLTEQERGFVRTLERLRAVLAGNEAKPPLAKEDLSSEEREHLRTVETIRERLRAGMARRETTPPLTKDELKNVEMIEQRAALRASAILRAEEQRRIRDIRSLVISATNNQPVRVEDVVEGGRRSLGELPYGESLIDKGVVVSHQTRLGQIGYWKADRERPSGSPLTLADVGHDEDDKVQCIVLLRKNEDTLPALKDVEAKVKELNDPASGRTLPGVKIEPYYDRTDLIHVTTETVVENLIVGVVLVAMILLMFLNNVRSALIVAINIPLALLFAFAMLFVRGKSANLLSIGAVDFGIIVDSSVIMVENIYRHISAGEYADFPLKERIRRAAREIERPLLFSTLIMMCAFIPLFTMTGPEGQLFGPMAQTYAFSLGGALFLAVMLSPVLCLIFFRRLQPARENFAVRWLKTSYLRQLERFLNHRALTLAVFAVLIAGTILLLPASPGREVFSALGITDDYRGLGHEFMPELEEGNIWIRGTGPLNQTLDRNVEIAKEARAIMASYAEIESIVTQSGRPDDGTDTAGYFNTEYFVPLRPEKDWPLSVEQTGWRRWLWGPKRARTKEEIVSTMNDELNRKLPGIIWNFSQNIRDNVMESLSGIKGDNSIKIFGPDIDQLETLATKAKNILDDIEGIENVGVFHIRGQSHLEFRVDPQKCERFGVTTADVNNVIASALGAAPQSNMIEGEKLFPIAIRWPKGLRSSETSILDIPVNIVNNQVVLPIGPGFSPSAQGSSLVRPDTTGSQVRTDNPITSTAWVRLRDLVSPVGDDGSADPNGQFERAGASDIYRENQKRMIAIKFSVHHRDLGGAVAEARERTKDLFQSPYRSEWSGEFEEMEDAESRLMLIIPLALALIFILLYSAFRSLLDSLVVLSNVVALSLGGIWALLLTGTNFSISAAVGFVSIFGVAIMDGLLLVSYFNQMRAHGMPLREAILHGAEKRVRPVMMTALTAILGLLPAALSTKIGSQTQRPLAIVVVGGMITTLFLTRYLMPVLYSFYGHREPPAGSGSMAH